MRTRKLKLIMKNAYFRFVIKRLSFLIPIILVSTFLVFVTEIIIPGDPVELLLGANWSLESYNALRAKLGIDDPLPIRYAKFLWALLQGDLGTSYITKRPVTDQIMKALPASIELAIAAMIIALSVGITLGALAAVKQNSITDKAIRIITVGGVSIPSFWLALMLILVFSVNLRLFPTSGRQSIVLPAITLSVFSLAEITRLTRASVLEQIRKEYVTGARAKGLDEKTVIIRHVLRNALSPILSIASVQVGMMIGGAIVTETIFSWPGMGNLIVTAIYSRDVPVLRGAILTVVILYLFINLFVDVLYMKIDPRVKDAFT